MKTFVEFTESMNMPVSSSFRQLSKNFAYYQFTVAGRSYTVEFSIRDSKWAHVLFTTQKAVRSGVMIDFSTPTNTNDGTQYKVMATVLSVFNQFADQHPEIQQFYFSGIDKLGTLYNRMIDRMLDHSKFTVTKNAEDHDGSIERQFTIRRVGYNDNF